MYPTTCNSTTNMSAFCKQGKLDFVIVLATSAVTAPTVPTKPTLLPILLIPLLISVAASLSISTLAPIDMFGFFLEPSINKT